MKQNKHGLMHWSVQVEHTRNTYTQVSIIKTTVAILVIILIIKNNKRTKRNLIKCPNAEFASFGSVEFRPRGTE